VIFEWDECKRRDNWRKHGLDFADCPVVFSAAVASVPDERFDYGEPRLFACGLLRDRVVVVAYAERGETIRVISMRRADKREQAFYFQSLQD